MLEIQRNAMNARKCLVSKHFLYYKQNTLKFRFAQDVRVAKFMTREL